MPPLPKNAPFLANYTPCSPGEDGCDSAGILINTTLLIDTIDNLNGSVTGRKLFRWQINGRDMQSTWSQPTVLFLNNSRTNGTYRDFENSNIYDVPEEQEWVYVLINNPNNMINGTNSASAYHPMHFHGHDFYILSQGHGEWNESNVQLSNPPRRDTTMLYGDNGYLLIAWKANNPGVWLLHCHIGWHTAMGFDLQIVEKRRDFLEYMDLGVTNRVCDEWGKYALGASLSSLQSASWDQAGV